MNDAADSRIARDAPAPGEPVDVEALIGRFRDRSARIGVIGLGYVGLPLARTIAERGFSVLGFDLDPAKVERLNAGQSYIRHISGDSIAALRRAGRLAATGEVSRLAEVDAILLCVPTPLTRQREPDLGFIVRTTESVAPHLRRGQLIVLESTTYPGTTREVMRPILERSGLRSGTDFFLAYSPEREDPGNPEFATGDIPKVVGGDGPEALRLACGFYDAVAPRTVPVSSLEAAEAVKLSENIFRAVNIALANELKTVFEAMGIDVWEVIEAAKTKPFGYMPFYPGPGLGGHCIPIDPFYLTWKAREFGFYTEFIELAGKVNEEMPYFCRSLVSQALNHHAQRAMKGSRILVLGVAYKPDIGDLRESPALKLISLLQNAGADVSYHDPHVPRVDEQDIELSSVAYEPGAYDCVVIVTDHSSLDYEQLVDEAPLVVDLRNATGAKGSAAEHVYKL